MQLLPDPPPCRRQGLRRLPRHHPKPQGPPYSDLSYLKKDPLTMAIGQPPGGGFGPLSTRGKHKGGQEGHLYRHTIVYKNALPDINFVDYTWWCDVSHQPVGRLHTCSSRYWASGKLLDTLWLHPSGAPRRADLAWLVWRKKAFCSIHFFFVWSPLHFNDLLICFSREDTTQVKGPV